MYQFSYAEILQDDPREARLRERGAFERAIELLKEAEEKGPRSNESAEALAFLRQLWTALIEDLVNPENGLPESLRADLISIGLWIMKEVDLIRSEKSRNFRGLSEVCALIRDGLK
jgi:flagellar protein FlaF